MTAVDYLSHNFNEFDLHECWRNATKNKDSLTNGRRLENASWRKFFQMKFALKTVSPVSLDWSAIYPYHAAVPNTFAAPPSHLISLYRNKDGDVNWLYGPFHTYEPLLVLQAAYKAATNQNHPAHLTPACGNESCPRTCDVCVDHENNLNNSQLKSALKKQEGGAIPQNITNLRDLYPGMRASSDPDIFSSSAGALGSDAASKDVFGATRSSIRANFERQAVVAPLSGRKADFFLASSAERARRQKAKLIAAALEHSSSSDLGSMDSLGSNPVLSGVSVGVSPLHRTIRFAEDTSAGSSSSLSNAGVDRGRSTATENRGDATFGATKASFGDIVDSEESLQLSPHQQKQLKLQQEKILSHRAKQEEYHPRKVGFASGDDDGDDEDENAGEGNSNRANVLGDEDEDEEEMDLLVTQRERSRYSEDESSDDDTSAQKFGVSIRAAATKAAFSAQGISASPTYTHSTTIGLQRTPSTERGLNKLSSYSGSVPISGRNSSNSIVSQVSSSGGGGLQRTSSFEKGLSKLQSLNAHFHQ
ncbi:hypothetical protein HDU83_009310 [Entophlyctis luteolus]|nr:hypothetical protein HDU83_009310 [Entophlyctis luteolus]